MVYIPLDADNEDQASLSGDVGRVVGAGNAGETDLLALSIAVLLDVLLSTLEDDLALLLAALLKLLAPVSKIDAKMKWLNQAKFRPERRLTFNSIDRSLVEDVCCASLCDGGSAVCGSTYSLLLLSGGGALSAGLLLALALLEEGLGDQDLVLGRSGTRGNQIST